MHSLYDYKRYAVLYVDDEEKSLKYFTRAFGGTFQIATATNAAQAYGWLQQHRDETGILLTDQRMPGEKGVQLLERTRQLNPRIIRILVTAYSDLDAAIQAVNTGAIYKYITKPWDLPQLETTLKRGLEFFIVQRERDQLLREKIAALHNLLITDRVISLGLIAAGMGHYVRNSLVAVRTFLDLAPAKLEEERLNLDELRNPMFWRDFYGHVRCQLTRITDMLHVIAQVTESRAGQLADSVQPGEIVEHAVARKRSQFDAKAIALDVAFPPDLPRLLVNRPAFERLFDFLLDDELANLPQHSQVRIRGRALAPPEASESVVELEVTDNGPGLPEMALRSVFDPFFLRGGNPQEFGINLMACYFIVYHHGGHIDVQSREGQGVTFKLTFPTKPAPAPSVPDEQELLNKVLLNDRLWDKLLAGM